MINNAQGINCSRNSQLIFSTKTTWVLDLLALTSLFVLFYFLKLGSYPLFTPDEGRYSEVAREMLFSGDFITPRLNGVVFLDKPIMYYWLQAIAIQLFGLNEWALRFWPAVFGIWGCLSLYISGRILFNRRTGLLASLTLATSALYFGAAHYANLDLEVAVLVSTTLLFFFLGIKATRPFSSHVWIYLAYTFAGLAILTKGLIGFAFPAAIVGSWTLLTRQWQNMRKLHLLTGPCLTLAIILPWYLLAQKANPEFFHFFFIVQQISRFLSTTDFNNQVAWWFYFPIVLAGFLPWTLFIAGMLISNTQAIWKQCHQEDKKLYLLLWVLLIFTFFSIPHSKTLGYILPIFPALALLVGQYLDQYWDKLIIFKKYLLLLPISFAIFALACLIAPLVQKLNIAPNLFFYLNAAGVDLLLTSLVLLYFLYRKSFTGIWLSTLCSAVIFLFILVSSAAFINQNSTKFLALDLKQHLHPEDEVVTFFKYFQDLPLYLERRITIVADWQDPGISHNDNWLRELWYGKSFQDTSAWLINESNFWKRWYGPKRLYVLTHLKYYDHFKAKAKQRLYVINQQDETVLVTNFPYHQL